MSRQEKIVKTSIIGIVVNLILVAFKAVIGVLTNSIAITLDAVNNLTDALSSIITIIGAKLAGKAPDKSHPYGYGRRCGGGQGSSVPDRPRPLAWTLLPRQTCRQGTLIIPLMEAARAVSARWRTMSPSAAQKRKKRIAARRTRKHRKLLLKREIGHRERPRVTMP